MKKITKNKLVTYACAAGGTSLLCGLLSALVFHYLPLYIVLWSFFGASLGVCLARVFLHIYFKDNSAEMWQVTIYHFIASGAIVGVIYAETWGLVSLFAAILVGMGLMAAASRFVRYHGGTLLIYHIEREMRYFPIGDKADELEDENRPLIPYGDEKLTIAEAEARGFQKEADEARTLMYKIYGIEDKLPKKKSEDDETTAKEEK